MDIKRSLETLSLIAFAIALVLSLPLVAGFFGSAHPALDSLAHFRVHLAVVMILFATLALGGSMWRHGLMAIAFGLAAIGTAMGIPASLGQVHAAFHPKDDAAPAYRLLQMNLRFDNAEPGKVLSLIGRTRPDIITLDEVSQMWAQKLDLLSSAYPHRIVCTMENHAGGVAILSLRPFVRAARCLDGGVFAVADIDLGGRLVQVGALHLHWPWPFDQSGQIDRLAAPLGEMAGTAILAGDLNATPWSASARRVAEAGTFQRVKVAGPTWLYRRLPEALRFAGLPIDHIFAKGDVMVHSARTLEAAGSDHLPVLMEFSLKPAPETPGETSQPEIVVQSSAGTPAG